MNAKRTMLIKSMRRQMIEILRAGGGYRQTELQKKAHATEYWSRNHSEAVVYVLIGECVRIYDADFYRDPSTGRIFMTRRALIIESMEDRPAGTPAAAKRGWVGNTASGRTGEALEAREGQREAETWRNS